MLEGMVQPGLERMRDLRGRNRGKRCQWVRSCCSDASHYRAEDHQRRVQGDDGVRVRAYSICSEPKPVPYDLAFEERSKAERRKSKGQRRL